MTKKAESESRRRLLKQLAAGGGVAVTAKSLPEQWTKPVVDSVLLPTYAQTTAPLAFFGTKPFGPSNVSICIRSNPQGTEAQVEVRAIFFEGERLDQSITFVGSVPIGPSTPTNLTQTGGCYVDDGVSMNITSINAFAIGTFFADEDGAGSDLPFNFPRGSCVFPSLPPCP